MAKKTPFQKLMAQSGIFPFAPVRLARTGAQLNAASSVLLGKDMENNFVGGGSMTDSVDGGRFDIVELWRVGSQTPLEKAKLTGQAWLNHALGSFTALGFKRAVAPVVVTEIGFQVAKGMKANKLIPPQFRKFVRFT